MKDRTTHTGTLARQTAVNARIFRDSEDCDRASYCVLVAFLLASLSNEYMEEVKDITEKYGLHKFELKHMFSAYQRTFNLYNVGVREMIVSNLGKQVMVQDYETLAKLVRDLCEHSNAEHTAIAKTAPEEIWLTHWAADDESVKGYRRNLVGHAAVRYVKDDK